MAQVFLKHVRISFIDRLWTPGEFESGDGRFRRSATFIVDPNTENAKKLKAAIKEAAAEGWKAKADTMLAKLQGDPQKFCVIKDKTNSMGEVYEGFEGMLAVTANRAEKQGPVLVVARDGRTVLAEGSGVIYGGCYVNANIELYAQVNRFPGMRASLLGVQYDAEGEAFTGGSGPIESFADLDDGADAGEVTDETETEGEDTPKKPAFNF